jgi:hypothetical protein
MMQDRAFDSLMARVTAGERLDAGVLARLEAAPDILALGMLADAARRRLHGADATFVRVAEVDPVAPSGVPDAAREVRLARAPETLDEVLAAVAATRAAAGERTVSGLAWDDVARYAATGGQGAVAVLRDLRQAGLDALARVPLDIEGGARGALDALVEAGYRQLRVTVARVSSVGLFADLAAFQDEMASVQAVAPLPYHLAVGRPTTGYHDVRAVALARLAAPNVPCVQVNWAQYGPKLAQVALTFGADDLDGVSADEGGADGWRRAPLAEVRRNIEAAGLAPVERDGRFAAEAQVRG